MSTTDPQRPGGPAREGEPGTDSGRHAVARPVPTPPDPAAPASPGPPADEPAGPAPAAPGPPTTAATHPATSPAAPRTTGDDRAQAGTATAGSTAVDPDDLGTDPSPDRTHDRPREGDTADRRADDDLFPDPSAPRTVHPLAHVLGALVGLLLAPVAALVTLVGQSRVLTVQANDWDASLEVLGIVLVSVGVLLLAAVGLLALWTPAVPLTGGVVLGVLGGLALYAPGIVRREALALTGDAWSRTTVETTVAATSGTLLAVGVLLLVTGVVAAVARRRGVHLGAFRERNRAA